MGIADYIRDIFMSLETQGTFIHGADWEKNLNDKCNFPILYLDDPIYSNDKFSAGYLGSVFPVKLIFADKSQLDWTMKQQYQVIDPMREISRKFLLTLYNDANIKSMGSIRRWDMVNLFDINVSGVALQMEIELFNTYSNCL